MGTHTSCGSRGAVSTGSVVANVSNWTATVKETSHSAVTSASKKGTVVISGTCDWEGSFSTYSVSPPAVPGQKLTFTGFTGADGTDTGGSISGPIIITSVSTTINIGTGEPVKWDVSFQGNGKPTIGTTEVLDTAIPALVSAAGATVSLSSSASTLNVTQVTINVQCAVSGGTATSNSEGWLKRFGGPFTGTVSLAVQDSRIDAGLELGEDLELEVALSNGTTMTVSYVHITDFGGVSIDNSSPEPIQFTINGTWNCHDGSAFGEITLGGASVWSGT